MDEDCELLRRDLRDLDRVGGQSLDQRPLGFHVCRRHGDLDDRHVRFLRRVCYVNRSKLRIQ